MTTQEPVAWYRDEDGIRMYFDAPYFDDATPLYSAQREWVGLTREDIQAAFDTMTKWGDYAVFAQALEAKLKEKNN